MKKWMIPFLYITVLIAAWFYRENILVWIQSLDSPALLVLPALLLALFPIVPYKAVIAVLGYALGTLAGAFIAWVATTAASMIVYLLAASFYRESGRRLLKRYPTLDRFTHLVEQHPFKALFIARLLPILPQTAVNIYSGIASIPLWLFTLASGLGKIPSLMLYAFLGSSLSGGGSVIAFAAVLILAAAAAALIYKRRSGKQS